MFWEIARASLSEAAPVSTLITTSKMINRICCALPCDRNMRIPPYQICSPLYGSILTPHAHAEPMSWVAGVKILLDVWHACIVPLSQLGAGKLRYLHREIVCG